MTASQSRRDSRRTLTAAALASVTLLVAGCGTSSGGDTSSNPGGSGFQAPDIKTIDSIGAGEGELNVLAWPGYAESGDNDPKVDWVSPFETETGCRVNVKEFGTSDEAVSLMHAGGYDVVSASGDATLRLIAAGDVQPVNTDLVPNYADVSGFLKDQKFNSVDGQMWGIPHGWGANLLMYNTDAVKPPPTTWGAVFDSSSEYAGKVTAYDSPIYVADAALYLMNTQPDLGIKNPYALDQDQLDAAVTVLEDQKANIGEYWSDYTKEVQAFKSGSTVIGTTWQVIANLTAPDAPVQTVFPDDGSTGWSDTWMVAANGDHTNCAYMWLDWMASPKVQAQVAEWFGEAPANPKACQFTSKGFCQQYHVSDEAYAAKIWYWTTPITQCLDGRTDVECTDYKDWTDTWTQIKG
ncbi:MAG: ABC transporter substrate-binding protein [Propionibacteriales bacterium]|nr:ABC transporter substrate-binding protein [Propionibacteriales bacterium]